jgi:hypothetical protein
LLAGINILAPEKREVTGSTPCRPPETSRDEDEREDELLDLPPLTSTNDDECSGGETRTLNLAGPLKQDQYQHPFE